MQGRTLTPWTFRPHEAVTSSTAGVEHMVLLIMPVTPQLRAPYLGLLHRYCLCNLALPSWLRPVHDDRGAVVPIIRGLQVATCSENDGLRRVSWDSGGFKVTRLTLLGLSRRSDSEAERTKIA